MWQLAHLRPYQRHVTGRIKGQIPGRVDTLDRSNLGICERRNGMKHQVDPQTRPIRHAMLQAQIVYWNSIYPLPGSAARPTAKKAPHYNLFRLLARFCFYFRLLGISNAFFVTNLQRKITLRCDATICGIR